MPMIAGRRLPKNLRALRAVRPNAGLEADYRRGLFALITTMHKATARAIERAYRGDPPEMSDIAEDAAPFERLTEPQIEALRAISRGDEDGRLPETATVRQLEVYGLIRRIPGPQGSEAGAPRWELTDQGETVARAYITPAARLKAVTANMAKRWQARFDAAAPRLAAYFTTAVNKRSATTLRNILKDGGFSVEMQMTPVMRDVIDASVAENVALIKSIPAQYATQVEGLVMRSVTAGRDLATLSQELQKRFAVTKKRAELIARDQNNKVMSALVHARQADLGFRQAVWMHSGAGKEPRPQHVAMNGKLYDITKGMWDPVEKKYVLPGELINCFPASTKIQLAHDVDKGYRRWFCGELAEIITASGKTLRATPNHPVLTPDGWRPIGTLDEVDYVIESADHRITVAMPEYDVDDRVPLLGEIFESLTKSGRLEVSLGAEFHGDRADGDVDIVLATGELRFGPQAILRQGRAQLGFPVPDNATLRERFVEQFLRVGLRTATNLVRSLSQPLAPGYAFSPHTYGVSFAAIAGSSAGGLDASYDSVARYAVAPSKRENARTRFVLPTQPTRLVKVNRSSFEGHVFNLQTASGWYVAEGIITHNCRCTSRPVLSSIVP